MDSTGPGNVRAAGNETRLIGAATLSESPWRQGLACRPIWPPSARAWLQAPIRAVLARHQELVGDAVNVLRHLAGEEAAPRRKLAAVRTRASRAEWRIRGLPRARPNHMDRGFGAWKLRIACSQERARITWTGAVGPES